MKLFQLHRIIDTSGISGTGIIAEGVELSNKKVIVCWLGDKSSIVIWDNMEALRNVNCHNNNTKIIWL